MSIGVPWIHGLNQMLGRYPNGGAPRSIPMTWICLTRG